MALISDRTWSQIRGLRTSGLQELQDKFSMDTFASFALDREDSGADTWDNGKKGEAWIQVATGEGKLSANGEGGPTIGEGLIYMQAPYVFRTDLASGIVANQRLVINGSRLFKVEAAPIEDSEKPIIRAYLAEIFGVPLPEVTP